MEMIKMVSQNYPFSFIELNFGGTFYGTSEVWQCGIELALEAASNNANLDADVIAAQIMQDQGQAIATALTTFIKTYGVATNGLLRMDHFTLRGIDYANNYDRDANATWKFSPSVQGWGNTAGPLQIACCFSFVADQLTKQGRISRFFLPYAFAGATIPNTAQASAAAAVLVRTLNQIGANPSPTPGIDNTRFYVANVSRVAGGGELNTLSNNYPHVAEVWVGDVADTIRRRRNRLPEAYAITPIVDGSMSGDMSSLDVWSPTMPVPSTGLWRLVEQDGTPLDIGSAVGVNERSWDQTEYHQYNDAPLYPESPEALDQP